MKIGGSSAAAICGVSPWETPLEVYFKLTGQITIPDNPAMYFGRKLEPIVRDRYQEITGRRVTFNDDPAQFGIWFQHPVYDFIGGSLDGISRKQDGTDNRVLEVKTARSRDVWDEGVPEHYMCQVQHYLACTGFEQADVAVLFGAADFDIFEVQRDQELIDLIILAEVTFWNNHLLPGIPPEPTTPADRNIRWPRSQAKAVEGDEYAHLIADLKAVRMGIAAMEKQKEEIEAQIKDVLQDNDTLTIGGKAAVTWKQSKASMVFNKDLFSIEHPELFRKYFVERPGSRRLLIK